MVRVADAVTTTSPPLSALFRDLGARAVHVVENYLPRAFTARPAAPHDGVVVGWVAGDEHVHDARALGLGDALRDALERDPRLRVRTIGVVDLGLPQERWARTRIVQYDQLGSEIAQFDIGIAPLDDVVFNRARSNVKLKEYAYCGVPWLASPIGPYASMGEKQGGRLVCDGEWADEVVRLAGRERERRKLAKKARKWGEQQTAARNLGPWEDAMADAVERARHRCGR